ncbi:hypothetical protein J1614_006185 [Plenodomus biglobosus]|nr:hypothetical protein J1614_006185 [Plenodomus biglobosus]
MDPDNSALNTIVKHKHFYLATIRRKNIATESNSRIQIQHGSGGSDSTAPDSPKSRKRVKEERESKVGYTSL